MNREELQKKYLEEAENSDGEFIVKKKRYDWFVQMDKDICYDRNLSLKAKGLLAVLLSFPPDWKIRYSHILDLSKDSSTSLISGLKELQKAGYIYKTERKRNKRGEWVTRYFAFEDPSENPFFEGFGLKRESGINKAPSAKANKVEKRQLQKIRGYDINKAYRDSEYVKKKIGIYQDNVGNFQVPKNFYMED
jgi:hypothetical protein